MAFDAYFPHITLPKGKTDYRMGDGIAMICAGQVMLVDGFQGGQPTDGLKAWLDQNKVKDIDIAVLTHPHWDHYNGLLQIEEDSRFHIKLVYMYDPLTLKHGCDGSANGRSVKEDMDNAYKWIRAMQAHGTRVLWIDKGSTIKFGDITWKIFREQPTRFTEEDQGNGWAFVNNGSLCLYSPETELIFPGDGPDDQERMMDYFGGEVSGTDVTHHMGSWTQHNAKALKRRGCVVAFGSCVEKNGPGTSGWTQYGGRRIKEEGIPLWGQEADIYIHADNGTITFRQGDKTISKSIPYHREIKEGWVKNTVGWWYRLSDGSYAKGWRKCLWSKEKVKGSWFLFGQDGYMLTGWQKVNGKWYYLDPDTGAMKTGWIFVNGIWYYLEDSGAMHTGWMDWKDKKCYLDPSNGHCLVDCTRTIDGKTYRFDRGGYATEITGGAVIDRSKKFIDISEFQGNVDWSKAAGTVGAVYIRCGLRGSLKDTAPADYKLIRYDRKWKRNLAEVQKYGIPFSAYYFPTAINDAEALEGAKWFYEVVKDLNLAFPLALDSENVWGTNKEAGRANGLSKSERTRLLKIVTDYFNEKGMNIGIYASASWLNSKVDMSAFPQCVRDCTWVADSTGAVDYNGYYWLHQYGKGACAGFGDDVDLNRITGTIPHVRIGEAVLEDPIDVALGIAQAEVGTHEGANNKTKYGDEMHAIQPRNMDKNAAWCDAFVDWVILQMCRHFGYGETTAKKVLCGDFDDYTYNSVNLYKKAGRWSQTPNRGDQIFFGGSGHTGIVTAVESGIVKTIEGNKSDTVKACSYSTSSPSIIGYGRPRYELITGQMTAEDMPLIKRGSKCEAVKKLQQILNAKGYKLSVDGDFGPATEAAVKAYQKANHLEVDGEVGEKTWASLMK